MQGAGWELYVPVIKQDLVMSEAAGDLLVYDPTQTQLHHLNALSRQVWRACDGRRTVGAVARETGLAEEMVHLAVEQLSSAGLLDQPVEIPETGSSRRRLLKRAGAVAVPAVVSLTVPFASAHASTNCADIPDLGCYMLISIDPDWCWVPIGSTQVACIEENRMCNHGGTCTAWCPTGSVSCVGQTGPGPDPEE